MQNIAIEFKNVTKVYRLYKNDKSRLAAIFSKKIKFRKKIANKKISLKIYKGESIVILGRNGAGKSTFLKMITGVIFPTKGDVIVNGRVSALLELTAGFDQEFTGRENIYIKGNILGLEKHEIQKIENSIIDFSELSEYIDQPVRTYSSGMKSRLGFAINSSINPDILVIDEALSVGDFKFRKKCNKRINELISKEHVTVLYVTHNPSSALDICSRGIIMDKGWVTFDGNIDEAIEMYLN